MNRRTACRLFIAAMAAPISAFVLARKPRREWSYVAHYDALTGTWACTDCINCHVGEDGKMRFPESA